MKNPGSFTLLLCTFCFVLPIVAFTIGSFIVSFLNWDYVCDQEIVSMATFLLIGTSLNTIYLLLGLISLYTFYQCGYNVQEKRQRMCSWWFFMVINTFFTILFFLDGGVGIYFIFYKKMYSCLQDYKSLWVFTILLIIVDFLNVLFSLCMCGIYKSYFGKNKYIRVDQP